MNTFANWFGRIVWIGIFMNMLFVVPAFFFPEKMCELLGLKQPDPIIWVQSSGMLLFIISIFYIFRPRWIHFDIEQRQLCTSFHHERVDRHFFSHRFSFADKKRGSYRLLWWTFYLVLYPQFSCSWLFGPEIIRVVTHNTVSHRERATI
jgi:hypothetical protein